MESGGEERADDEREVLKLFLACDTPETEAQVQPYARVCSRVRTYADVC